MATHFLYSSIDRWSTYELSQFLLDHKDENIIIRINSNGGNVDDGIAMYNLLQSYRGSVTTIVDGKCNSAAILVFCAGDKRYMNLGTTMFLHKVSLDSIYGANADDLRKHADTVEKFEQIILSIYMRAIGKSDDDTLQKLKDMMNNETLLTAEEAVEIGFCEISKQTVYIDKNVVEYVNQSSKIAGKLYNELEAYKKQELEQLLQDVPEEAKKSIAAIATNNIEEAKKLKEFILKNSKPSVASRIQQEHNNKTEWTLEDWRKKDPSGLERIKKDNPEYFNELLNLKK